MTALVWLVLGCNLFQDGDIQVTCDDLSDCADPIPQPDDTGEWDTDDVALSLGVGYSALNSDSWTIAAHKPDLSLRFQRSGLGDLSGAFDYNPTTGRGILVTTDRLYVFGPGDDQLTSFEMSGTAWPIDIARTDAGILILVGSDLLYQQTPAEPPSYITDLGSEGLALLGVGDVSYILTMGSTQRGELIRFNLATNEVNTYSDITDDPATTLGGGMFIDQDGELAFCSTQGDVHRLSDLTAGVTTPTVQHESTDTVLRCAWDPSAERYLAIQEDGTLLVTTTDGTSDAIPVLDSGLAAVSGHFFYTD